MKPPGGLQAAAWLRRCVEVADAVSEDVTSKADYLTDLAILSGLILDYDTIRKIIVEATMHESSVIQHFLQQGIEQGTRESLIEGILENLEVRFGVGDLRLVRSRLEGIETLHQLRQLRRAALQVTSLEAFAQTLDFNGNS